jgi:hypothetical protein
MAAPAPDTFLTSKIQFALAARRLGFRPDRPTAAISIFIREAARAACAAEFAMALADISLGPIGTHARTTASSLRRFVRRALGTATAIATALRPARNGRPVDVANLSDRLRNDIGLPPGLFGPPDRHWSDYR